MVSVGEKLVSVHFPLWERPRGRGFSAMRRRLSTSSAMKTFALSVIGIACVVAAVAADDRAVAEKLRALGGKVTEENGVVTTVSTRRVGLS